MTGLSGVSVVAVMGGVSVVILAVGAVIGPAWRERRQCDQERRQRETDYARTHVDRRYERALGFVEALTRLSGLRQQGSDAATTDEYPTREDMTDARVRLARFIATLRSGEGDVARWCTWQLAEVERNADMDDQSLVDEAIIVVFGWLRGDVALSAFRFESRLDLCPSAHGADLMRQRKLVQSAGVMR